MKKLDIDFKEEISSYNEAAFQIYRLHFLWMDVNNAAKNGKYNVWKNTLDRIWMEIVADVEALHEKRRDEKYKVINTINKNINKSLNDKNLTQLARHLSEKEKFIRITADEIGKGSARKDTSIDL